MPFFPGIAGRIHWRHWPVDEPHAGVVFAHGMGQHTGHYHRFARGLAAHGVAMWGIDLAGHGLSEGRAGQPGRTVDHAADLATLTGIAEARGVPLVLMGHSLGAAATLTLLRSDCARFRGAVLCGTPQGAALPETAHLLATGGLTVLAVHGVDDRLAPVAPVRAWAGSVPAMRWREYADAGHDLLHEPVHRRVTDDVAEFVLEVSGSRQR